jgi:hypothetical protein
MPASIPPPYLLAECPRTRAEDLRLLGLVDQTLAGDERAWQHLCISVALIAWIVSGSPIATARLRESMDDRIDVGVRMMEVLRRRDFAVLRRFRASQGHEAVRAWLVSVAESRCVDHVRAHKRRLGKAEEGGGAGGARFVPLSPALLDGRPSPATAIDAHRIAAAVWPRLSPAQRGALGLWLQGESSEAIAEQLGLPNAGKAAKLVELSLRKVHRLIVALEEAVAP